MHEWAAFNSSVGTQILLDDTNSSLCISKVKTLNLGVCVSVCLFSAFANLNTSLSFTAQAEDSDRERW